MSNFSDEIVDKVWRKGRTLDGWNSDEYRLDAAGAIMVKSHRGTDDIDDYPEYTRALVFDEAQRRNVESEIGKVVNEDVQRQINSHYGLRLRVVLGDHSLD